MTQSETNRITTQALAILTALGCHVWRQNNVSVRGRRFVGLKGVPDIVGMTRSGTFIGVEVKGPGDKQSEWQVRFSYRCTDRGAIYICASHSDDILKHKREIER
jgi:hypothetical protein